MYIYHQFTTLTISYCREEPTAMLFLGFVAKLWPKIKTPKPETISLPPYSELSGAEGSSAKPSSPAGKQIKTTDVPQWTWTTSQCQEYISAILVKYCEYSIKDAEDAAKKFKGFGPVMYGMTNKEWIALLGEPGRGIGNMIHAVHWKKGAVPRGIMELG